MIAVEGENIFKMSYISILTYVLSGKNSSKESHTD